MKLARSGCSSLIAVLALAAAAFPASAQTAYRGKIYCDDTNGAAPAGAGSLKSKFAQMPLLSETDAIHSINMVREQIGNHAYEGSSSDLKPTSAEYQEMQRHSMMLARLRNSHPKITAAYTRPRNGATYLFYADGRYTRTSAHTKRGMDRGYPQALPGGWRWLPRSLCGQIDAAIPWTGKGGFSVRTADKQSPQTRESGLFFSRGKARIISDVNFGQDPEKLRFTLPEQIDAAFVDPVSGNPIIVRSNTFITVSRSRVLPPRPLGELRQNLPFPFWRGVDAATVRDGRLYLITGYEYVRFTGNTLDDGYPKTMDNFPE